LALFISSNFPTLIAYFNLYSEGNSLFGVLMAIIASFYAFLKSIAAVLQRALVAFLDRVAPRSHLADT
jgi:hypothetical protein